MQRATFALTYNNYQITGLPAWILQQRSWLYVLLILATSPAARVEAQYGADQKPRLLFLQPDLRDSGWRSDYLGFGRGHFSISLGAQFWNNYFQVRNLIGRASLDLAPGVRANLVGRRREGRWAERPFVPDIDEAYLEAFRFYRSPELNLGASLRLGRVRYIRFPYPDQLATFDQVPQIDDLYGGPVRDYRGGLFTFEAAHRSGLGLHFTGIRWGFDADQSGMNAVEWYAFFRRALAAGWSLEARAGALATRTPPLGTAGRRGASLFVGKQMGDVEVGVMAERRRGESAYTGIMVRFRPTGVTRALGAFALDYQRQRQGFSIQHDLFEMNIGASKRAAGPDEELVGEVYAVRLRTYWEQGFERNEYEHRIGSWGETGARDVRVVVEESPWLLELESLVSPHLTPGTAWLRDRQGPGQLRQEVVYRSYRRKR
jgi:hypothetical protein